jgi:hypothetical protein
LLRLALEDAIIVAQDCDDEPRERDYLRLLHGLEAAAVPALPERDHTVTSGP